MVSIHTPTGVVRPPGSHVDHTSPGANALIGSDKSTSYEDPSPFSDRDVENMFQRIQNDLEKDENFIPDFMVSLDNKRMHTFSNGSSLESGLVAELIDGKRNVLHHFIDYFSQSRCAETFVERVVLFIKLLLNRWPEMILDGLQDGQTPLDEAVSKDNCFKIIEAICEHEAMNTGPQQKAQMMAVGDEHNLEVENGFVSTTEDGSWAVPKVSWRGLTEENKDTCLHKAIKKKNNDYAIYLLTKIQATGAVELLLGHFGQDGLTPLHLAVDFARCYEDQVEFVERLVGIYPVALTLKSRTYFQTPEPGANGRHRKSAQSELFQGDRGAVRELKQNLSPYRYFLDTRERQQNSAQEQPNRLTRQRLLRTRPEQKGNPGVGRKMEELLSLSCMRHYGNNRVTITELLPKSLGQIHFDLNPRTEVSRELLYYISESEVMRFEPYLQYVYIPNLRVRNVRMDSLEAEPWWESHSRKDYVYIFEWLKKTMKVKRILKIVVEDDPNNVHSDEAIERAVGSFDVEEWNWVKLDICSDTILAAARNVRVLNLHWSGNKAILKSWAAPDGLALLKELRTIRIMTPEPIESHDRTYRIITEFKDMLEKSWGNLWKKQLPYRKPPLVDIQPLFTQAHVTKRLSETEREEKGRKEKWLKCTENFSQILKKWFNNYLAERNTLSEDQTIKVAVIDDGVDIDRDDIGRNIALGETFYDNKGHWPGFYQSAYGHGNLMASQIRQICPKVQLYIAKLNEVWSDGKPQITAKSAAQAIDWARSKHVDIISMSWSIETPEDTEVLKAAVEAALDDEILLFCASNDQGNLTEIPYPARVAPAKIFKIGSATALGLREDTAQEYVNFIAPGSETLKKPLLEDDQGFAGPRSGSSIATARCAGLAAVILQCIMLTAENYTKKEVRTQPNMTRMLKRLVDENDQHNYLRVWKVFDVALEKAKLDKDYEWNVIRNVASVFLGTANWLPQLPFQPSTAEVARRLPLRSLRGP